jgi:pseudaminic acid cytidylyltransferase
MKIAIIPARAGSKRIKNKNIINIFGKPMIQRTIEILLKSKLFDMIIVSSDSKKIQNISRKAGAKVLFTRPKNLANDFVGTFEVINHTINHLMSINILPQYVCCVYPTSIMLKPSDIKNSYKKIREKNCDFALSVTDYGHPPQRGFYLKNNSLRVLNKKFYKQRTQDLDKIYHDAGQFYWGKTSSWLKNKFMFSKKCFGLILPRHRAIDIDDKEDLYMLKKVFNNK